jgi:hypothetical protein
MSFGGVPSGLGDDEPFEIRLGEAIAWCALHANVSDPHGSLRSGSLHPSILPEGRQAAVRSLVGRRGESLRLDVLHGTIDPPVPACSPAELQGGRLLYAVPDETLWDGTAESESEGFFDIEDIPPWDTWLALYKETRRQDVLVSWVPREYVPIAERAIRVLMVDNVGWLTNANFPFVELFRQSGLI